MKRILQRLLRWLYPAPFDRLLLEATVRGRVSMSQVSLGKKDVGWYVSIRPPYVPNGPHSHRYAWTGQSDDLSQALTDALVEAREFPIKVDMTVDTNAPKLGGAEFDE